MKLETKHLAPYLPYGLKFCNTSLLKTLNKNNQKYNPPTLRVIDVNGSCWLGKEQDSRSLNDGVHKPILRPLSDLSEYLMVLEHTEQWQDEWIEHFMDFDFKPYEANINACPQDLFGSMLENHFDVFGLIPKNLAIDINTLNK